MKVVGIDNGYSNRCQFQLGWLNLNQRNPISPLNGRRDKLFSSQNELVRFAVVLTEAVPDLYSTILETPARLRAERMRVLASLGLHIGSGRAETTFIADNAFPNTTVIGDQPKIEVIATQPAVRVETAVLSNPKAPTSEECVALNPLASAVEEPPVPVVPSAKDQQQIPIKAGKRIAWLARSLGG